MSRTLNFPENIARDFQAAVSAGADGAWTIRCQGQIDQSDASGAVQPELMRFHAELLAAGARRVEVDMHAVEYMNSSGLKGFIAWFLAAEFGADGASYQIDLVYDRRKTWQAVSLTVMEKVAPRAVKARAVSEAA